MPPDATTLHSAAMLVLLCVRVIIYDEDDMQTTDRHPWILAGLVATLAAYVAILWAAFTL